MAAAYQHVPGRHENEGNGGRLVISQVVIRQSVGDGQHVDARNRDVLGVAAVIQIPQHRELRTKVLLAGSAGRAVSAKCHGGQQDTLPNFQVGDVFAHLGDVAGDIAAVDVGKLDAGQSFSDEKVEMIQGAGLDPHQHLVFANLGIRNIFKLQNLGSAKFMEAYSLHQLSPGKLANVTWAGCALPLIDTETTD